MCTALYKEKEGGEAGKISKVAEVGRGWTKTTMALM